MKTLTMKPSHYKHVTTYFSEVTDRTVGVYMDVDTQDYVVHCRCPAIGLTSIAEYSTMLSTTEHAVAFIKGDI
jgi:hypothetical protein